MLYTWENVNNLKKTGFTVKIKSLVKKHSFIGMVLLSISSFSHAESNSSTWVHAQIEKEVMSALEQKLYDIYPEADVLIHLNDINPNLKIDLCSDDLIVGVPESIRQRFSVTVRCLDKQNNWKIHVRGSAQALMPVLVTSEGISRGDTISDEQLSYSQHNVLGASGDYFTDKRDVLGTQSRRPLPAGSVLRERMLAQPIVIERNEIVEVEIRRPNLSITFNAIAVEDARK